MPTSARIRSRTTLLPSHPSAYPAHCLQRRDGGETLCAACAAHPAQRAACDCAADVALHQSGTCGHALRGGGRALVGAVGRCGGEYGGDARCRSDSAMPYRRTVLLFPYQAALDQRREHAVGLIELQPPIEFRWADPRLCPNQRKRFLKLATPRGSGSFCVHFWTSFWMPLACASSRSTPRIFNLKRDPRERRDGEPLDRQVGFGLVL